MGSVRRCLGADSLCSRPQRGREARSLAFFFLVSHVPLRARARAAPACAVPLAAPHLDAEHPGGPPAGLTPAAPAWSGPGAETTPAAAQPWRHRHRPSWPAWHCWRGGGCPAVPQGGKGVERERNWSLAVHGWSAVEEFMDFGSIGNQP